MLKRLKIINVQKSEPIQIIAQSRVITRLMLSNQLY